MMNLQRAAIRLHNVRMNMHTLPLIAVGLIIVAKKHDGPTPPPLVRMEAPIEDAIAKADAENERDWELFEARQKTKELRAVFANRAYVEPDGKHLRISFGERVGDEDVYHTAVVVPLEEAFELADLLTRMSSAGLRVMWDQIYRLIEHGLAPPPSDKPNG